MGQGVSGAGVCRLVLAGVLAAWQAQAVSVHDADWAVHYNLPDQDTSSGTSNNPDEWAIRDALIARINALQTDHEGFLATYTFSGSSDCCGAAGPILAAVNAALERGTKLHMVVDSSVSLSTDYGGFTLNGLAARAVNKLDLEQEQDPNGIMHDKLGLFDYGPNNRWIFITSWNFTGGASSQQWNIALEARNEALFAAYKAEFTELLAGRFHNVPAKSRAHDNASFTLTNAWDLSRARFSPGLVSAAGGNHNLSAVTNAIAQAQEQIIFALNKITLTEVRDQLIKAANRGVPIHGVMPSSDTAPGGDSAAIYHALTNPASYLTTNRVRFWPAFARADGSTSDTGQSELVHAKYMAIDPFGERPVLIHGSANWTASALVFTNSNDENLLFVRHAAITRLFYAHFRRITGALQDQEDFWLDLAGTSTSVTTRLWVTDTNAVVVQTATRVNGPWAPLWTNAPLAPGFVATTNAVDVPTRFYRAVRAP